MISRAEKAAILSTLTATRWRTIVHRMRWFYGFTVSTRPPPLEIMRVYPEGIPRREEWIKTRDLTNTIRAQTRKAEAIRLKQEKLKNKRARQRLSSQRYRERRRRELATSTDR